MGSFVGKVILDSSVIIALFNDADAHHVAAMKALGESKNNFEISTVSLAEALSSVLSDWRRPNCGLLIKSSPRTTQGPG